MAKENVSSERSAQVEKSGVRQRLSREQIEQYFRHKTPEEREKINKRHERFADIRGREAKDRKKEEEQVLHFLENSLGIKHEPSVEDNQVLSEKESEALLSAIKEMGDDKPEEVMETFMSSLRNQKIFKEQFKIWEEQYSKNPDLRAKMSLEDFVRESGVRFIKENRKLIVRSQSDSFVDKISKGKGIDDKRKKDLCVAVYGDIDMFIQSNFDQMASYGTLDSKSQKKLLSKFKMRVGGSAERNGVSIKDYKEVENLFKLLVADLAYEAVAVKQYSDFSGEMIDNVDLDLTDDEWEEEIQSALEKNAKGELKEYLQKQQDKTGANNPSANIPRVSSAPEIRFSSVNDVAHKAGVNLREDDKEKGLYYIDSPLIKGEKLPFKLRIVYQKGSTDINDARFVVQDPWLDKDSPRKGDEIDGIPTKVFRAGKVTIAINTLVLDYTLNKGLITESAGSGERGVNDIITDRTMSFMAGRLFGFKLNEKNISEVDIDLYKRFLTVLLRDDKKSSLEDRVKRVKDLFKDDALIPYIKQSLLAKGASAKTLDSLIEESNMRRDGEIK
jgi:hypothetical protein